jgi:hypothetical protein
MRALNRTVVVGACALVVSCSATKQATYWTKESGVVVVHHVVGKTDSVEKLIQKQLSADELKADGLAKGKYFTIVQAHEEVTPDAGYGPPKDWKLDLPKKDSLSDVSKQLRDLRNQVKAVQAQNQRLQEELGTAASQKTAQQQEPADGPNDQQQDVRMSQ